MTSPDIGNSKGILSNNTHLNFVFVHVFGFFIGLEQIFILFIALK
jgi:hypothetical protein